MLKGNKKFKEKERDEKRDLESGDNPAEREKIVREKDKNPKKDPGERDLESGDNPEEREQISGK